MKIFGGLYFSTLILAQNCDYDETLIPGAWGESVAIATREKLTSVFDFDDRGFFKRFSFVDSNYGKDIHDHYARVQQLWPLKQEYFPHTKEDFLSEFHRKIYENFDINWLDVTYDELNIPLYSGIAFYLYLESIEAFPIKWDDNGQAELYNQISNKPVLTWESSVDLLKDIHNELCKNDEIDLVFLADESGSIWSEEYDLMKKFMADIIGDLNIGENATRVAVRTFDVDNTLHFSLAEFDEDLVKKTLEINKCGGFDCTTGTAAALADVLEFDFREASGMRKNSKKILVVLTDGESNSKQLGTNDTLVQAQRVHKDPRNIQVISIGVGDGLDLDELHAIATLKSQMFLLNDFDNFNDVKELITDTVCEAPIVTGEAETVSYITVSPAYFVAQLDKTVPGKLTVQLTMENRRTIQIISAESLEVFSSYTRKTPSEAVHDFRHIHTDSTIFSVKPETEVFYITLLNHGTRSASVEIEVLSSSVAAEVIELPAPVVCGNNALCGENRKCICKPDYAATCGQFEFCQIGPDNMWTATCACKPGYQKHDGGCGNHQTHEIDVCKNIKCGVGELCVVLQTEPVFNPQRVAHCECDVGLERSDGICKEKTNNNTLIFIVIGVLAIGIILFFVYRKNKVNPEEQVLTTGRSQESCAQDTLQILHEPEKKMSIIEEVAMPPPKYPGDQDCMNAVTMLLLDLNSTDQADILKSKLKDDQLSENVKQMATEVLSFQTEYLNLTEASESKDMDKLRASINEIELRRMIEKLRVKYKAFGAADQLEILLNAALLLRGKYDEMEKMIKKILELKQSVISEIRSYGSPPDGIHEVMMATYILLGERKGDVKKWKKVQALLGKSGPKGLKRQIQNHDLKNLRPDRIEQATELLKDVDLAEVKKLSEGAAVFYSWCTVTILAKEA